MAWVISTESDDYVGYPKPLVFKTKKEARIRRDKIVHQGQGGFTSLKLKEVNLPVTVRQYRTGRKYKRSGIV